MYLYIICISTSVVLGRASQPLQLQFQHFCLPTSQSLSPQADAKLMYHLPSSSAEHLAPSKHNLITAVPVCAQTAQAAESHSEESEISSKSPASPKIRNFISAFRMPQTGSQHHPWWMCPCSELSAIPEAFSPPPKPLNIRIILLVWS